MKTGIRFSASAAQILLYAALILAGGYHEYAACLLSAALLGALLWQAKKNGGVIFRLSAASLFLAVLVLALLASALWAVDPGTAFMGFLKFLPLLLYELLLQQSDPRRRILDRLPWAAGALTLLSAILALIPVTREYYTTAGRLGGIFQYPNSFAAFLLAAQMLLITREKLRWKEWLLAAVLLGGIFLTGSRIAFVLTVLLHLIALFTGPGKKRKWIALGVLALTLTGLFLYARFSGANNAVTRLFSLSLTESTLVGRVLYLRDALPLIAKNPFGLGYLGYQYVQQSIQTGVYTVRFIHCDPAQILLDAGWIPFGFFVAAVVRFFRSRATGRGEKLAGLAILLHCLLDFDLQYLALGFVLLLLSPPAQGKRRVIFRRAVPRRALTGALVIGCLYMATSFFFARFGQAPLAHALYPWNTPNEIYMLSKQTDVHKAGEIADHIAARNDCVQIVYSAKAREAYSDGDFGELIRIKNETFKRFPFAYKEYREYAEFLLYGISLYEKKGDEESAAYCREELLTIPDRLAGLEDRLSPLGKRIKDQPTTALPDDILAQIDAQRAKLSPTE